MSVVKTYKTLIVALKDLNTGEISLELPETLTNEDLKDFDELMSQIYRFMSQENWRINHDN